jgi:hypothetical protein
LIPDDFGKSPPVAAVRPAAIAGAGMQPPSRECLQIQVGRSARAKMNSGAISHHACAGVLERDQSPVHMPVPWQQRIRVGSGVGRLLVAPVPQSQSADNTVEGLTI